MDPKLVALRVCVILPNAGSFMLSTGSAKCGWLNALNTSHPQLRTRRPAHRNELHDAQVEIHVLGPADDVASRVAGDQLAVDDVGGKRRGVEPPLGRPLRSAAGSGRAAGWGGQRLRGSCPPSPCQASRSARRRRRSPASRGRARSRRRCRSSHRLPGPKGNSQTVLNEKRCGTSQSDGPRFSSGSKMFCTPPVTLSLNIAELTVSTECDHV